jgi:hypothetical protein
LKFQRDFYFGEDKMNRKKMFALRIDADLLAAIEKWAADEFRSTNGQLEWIIHRALKEARRLKKDADEPKQA